jgi:hypothetical protein
MENGKWKMERRSTIEGNSELPFAFCLLPTSFEEPKYKLLLPTSG